jgi:hypothetical protein
MLAYSLAFAAISGVEISGWCGRPAGRPLPFLDI